MKRREFMSLLGGAAAWPVAARAQQPAMPVIGYPDPGALEARENLMAGFRKGLSETGYVEGRNVAIEYRWANSRSEQFSELAADLVRRQVNVIAAVGSTGLALAAKVATATIPIVFQLGGDPVGFGLVASMNRPGANVTGVTRLSGTMGPKRLELLHEALPKAKLIAFLINPTNHTLADASTRDVQAAARVLGVEVVMLNASTQRELGTAFASLAHRSVDALLVDNDFLFVDQRQLVTLAASHSIPVMYPDRDLVAVGGLMSYAASLTDSYRQAGVYVGRVLKGEKPADLPVMQPTKFELVINVKTAKAIGLTIPESFLLRADELIE
jgi:putative tryptophan/tyrosine transport system substrate-binding protein